MHNLAIFFPVLTLVFWTFIILLLVPLTRVNAMRRREVKPFDFKYGESNSVPDKLKLPNRNFMNLLELPILFYIACILLFITNGTSSLILVMAWLFVIFRIIHSIIHLTYNKVLHRFIAFSCSNLLLLSIWVAIAIHLVSHYHAASYLYKQA